MHQVETRMNMQHAAAQTVQTCAKGSIKLSLLVPIFCDLAIVEGAPCPNPQPGIDAANVVEMTTRQSAYNFSYCHWLMANGTNVAVFLKLLTRQGSKYLCNRSFECHNVVGRGETCLTDKYCVPMMHKCAQVVPGLKCSGVPARTSQFFQCFFLVLYGNSRMT